MVQTGSGSRLALEAVERFAVAYEIVRNELKGHMPAKAQVLGFVNYAHASATDFPDDAVMGDRLADHEGPVGVMLGRWEQEVNSPEGGGKERLLERPPSLV
jgi:hypothetical protein